MTTPLTIRAGISTDVLDLPGYEGVTVGDYVAATEAAILRAYPGASITIEVNTGLWTPDVTRCAEDGTLDYEIGDEDVGVTVSDIINQVAESLGEG